MDELAERLIDQGDVGFAEQMMDVFRRAQDDPVERQLEQIAARLDCARSSSRRGSAVISHGSSCTSSIGPVTVYPNST